MKIFVIGSLNMDLVIKAPYLPVNGETLSGEGFMTNPGGKGANQATACGKLGGNVYMVGAVGDAFGDELISTLNGYNVKTDFVKKIGGVSSGIAVIVVVDGDNRIILDAGANGLVDKKIIDEALENASEGDYLICQLEIPLESVNYALKKGKEKGMVTVLNPAPAKTLPEGTLSYCDYFIPNQSEAQIYTGICPEDENSAKECVKKLNQMGVSNVIITMGTKGSMYFGGEEVIKVDSFKVNAIDTTAAGDTYVGALVTKLSEGADIKSAMTFASKAASITVTRRGAQQSIPFRKEVQI